MIDSKETREVLVNVTKKNKNIRVERVQQWRPGFELSYEVFVNDKPIKDNLSADEVIRYLGTVI